VSIDYSVRVTDAFGVYRDTISNFTDPRSGGGAALDYVLNVGKAGICRLTVPWPAVDDNLFVLDGRLFPMRSIHGRQPYRDGEAAFLIRCWEKGEDETTVVGYHGNSLMWRRIVAYAAGSSYSSKSATFADNLIKAFWLENFGASIVGADRKGVETQADISAYVTTQANLSAGASIGKAAAWRNVGDVIQEIGQASTTAGTYLAAEIVAPSESGLEVRTYTTQRGGDHRASSGQPVILSRDRGNLENARLIIDHSQEATFIIAGGSDTGANRLTATAVDTVRMAASPFNRIERFVDMGNVSDATQLQDEADAALWAARPLVVFTGDLIEGGNTIRGLHFDLGDMVTAEHRQLQYDVRLDTVHVSVGSGGQRSRVLLRSTT
jgi:hypothetical protein